MYSCIDGILGYTNNMNLCVYMYIHNKKNKKNYNNNSNRKKKKQ